MSDSSRGSRPAESAVPFAIVGSFMAGVALTFILFVYPQQRLMLKKDALVAAMADFNLQEQSRLADMRDISEAQLRKWVSINEQASRKYQEIFDRLRQQERRYSNPGLYWTTLMAVLTAVLVGYYIWVNKQENTKDLATLENFETFIDQRLSALGMPRELPDQGGEPHSLERNGSVRSGERIVKAQQ